MEIKTKKLIKYLILPLFLLASLSFVYASQAWPDHKLTIKFYDVGQGDSIFIQTYQGNQILIDGGPSKKILELVGKDMPFFDNQIELVVLSHPHADHVTGLIEVLKKYKVKKILMPEVEFNSEPFEIFNKIIEQKGIKKIYAYTGQRIFLDNATVLDIYFPRPGKLIADNKSDNWEGNKINPNNSSIVAKLSFGKTKVLFTGDAGFDIENWALPKFNLDADVLKVGHQGSKFSTSSEFLAEVTPTFSVIEVGKNSYGHPSPETLERLKKSNTQIYRTDIESTIEFISNGFDLSVKN